MSSKEITLNSKNLELEGKPLQIGEYISNGATANVFRGKYNGKDVAVKAIRDGAREGFYSEFKSEVQNLESLWEKWQNRGFTAPQVIPALYGYDVESEYPYIVEEFIDGKKLNHAMRDLPGGVFSEQQALFLAAQIGRILVILHNDLEKCYGDIKFNNFLIVGNVRDNSEPALKIFDWNVLGYSTQRNIQKDLLIVSNYILYMLTAELPRVDQDTLQVNKRPVEIKGFKNLTSGTRHFIETTLHPVIEHRFVSSEQWLKEAEKLLEWWKQEDSGLLKSAKSDRARAERESSLADYLMALAKAEILEKRGVQDAGKLKGEILEIVSGDKVVENAINLLWSGQHNIKQSKLIFDDAFGREQYRKNEKVVLWGWLVKAVQEIPHYLDHQLELQKSMDARLFGNYDEAYQGFQELSKEFDGIQPLIDLTNEAHALCILKDVSAINPEDVEDFNILHEKYKRAFDLSKEIPEALKKIAIDDWNIEKRLSESTEKKEALTEALSLWEQARNDTNESSQIQKIGDALERTPIQVVIFLPLKEMVFQALDAGKCEYAERLARIPSLRGHNDTWFDDAVRAARKLVVLQNDCQRLGSGIQALTPISVYLANCSTGVEDQLVFPHAFVTLLKGKFNAVKVQTLPDHELMNVRDLLKLLPLKLLEENPELQQFSSATLAEMNRRRSTRDQNKSKIDNLLGEMRIIREQIEILGKVELVGGNEMLPSIQAEKNRRILKVVENLSILKKVDQSLDIGEWTAWLDSVSLKIWVKIHFDVEERIRSDREGLSRIITEYLDKGNLAESGILLDIDGENEQGELQARYLKIKDFLAWGKNLPESEDHALEWIKESIPSVYWQLAQEETPSASQYFEGKARGILGNFSMRDLPSLVMTWWIYQSGLGNIANVPMASWSDVEKSAHEFEKSKSPAKQDKQEALLRNIALLENPNKPATSVKKGDILSKVLWVAGAAVLVAILVLGAGILWTRQLQSTPTPMPVVETSTPVPTNTPVGDLVVESTPVLPTTIPDSKYIWSKDVLVSGAPTAFPVGVELLYLLDGDPAVTYTAKDVNTWLVPEGSSANEGINGSLKYANLHTIDAGAEWLLDVPVNKAGLYAFYINDTKRYSWTSQPVTYQVFVGEELKSQNFGQTTLQLLKSDKQTEGGEWRCIGMYFLNVGDLPKVRMEVPALSGEDTLGVDAVGIAFVPDVVPSLSQLITYPNILYWVDDAQAIPEPSEGWQRIEESATWLGAHKLDLAAKETASVTWKFSERLSPGKYEVLAFIPAELAVKVSFNVSLNEASKLTREFPADSGIGGSFQSLGELEVPTKSDGLLFLTVTMKSVSMDTAGVFAYDNIILVPVANTPTATP